MLHPITYIIEMVKVWNTLVWSLTTTYHAFLVSGIYRSTIAHQFTYDNVLSIETCNVKRCVTIQVWGIHLQSNKVNTWICIDQLQNVDKVVFFK